MIDLNSYNIDNIDNMLKRIDQYLVKQYIYCNRNWLLSKIEEYKSSKKIEDDIYKEVIKSDINEFADTERIKDAYKIAESLDFSIKHTVIKDFMFMQINGSSNIAEPSEKSGGDDEENLDVVENFESKYLQSEDEVKVKTEKIILKFEMSNGVDLLYGFEYEMLKDIKKILNDKYPKILIGPNLEARRGVLYLRNNNVKLL